MNLVQKLREKAENVARSRRKEPWVINDDVPDRIHLMLIVQDCLRREPDVPWSLIVDTLIAKGYHRDHDREEGKTNE